MDTHAKSIYGNGLDVINLNNRNDFSYKLITEILKEEIQAVSRDYKSLLRTEIRDLNG